MTDSGDEAAGHGNDGELKEPPLLSMGDAAAYSFANLGMGAFYALNLYVLPLYLKSFTSNPILIGLMGGTHSFEGAVIQPLVGSASDRLRSPLGRRRPFMLAFVPLSALLILATPLAERLPVYFRLGSIVALIFLFTVSFNIAQDPYTALLPDIVPERQRGRVNGAVQLVGVLGQALLLLVPINIRTKLVLAAVLMLVTTLVTCVLVREPARPSECNIKGPYLAGIGYALIGLRDLRQAARVLLTQFFSGLGVGAILPFLTVFVQTITHCTDTQALQMPLILMAATAIGVAPFGWLADRLGPKPVLLIGFCMIGAAAANGLWVNSMASISLVMCIAGLGNAAQTAAAYPLLTEVVPLEEIGFYTGLQSTALSIAGPLTALITGTLIERGGYRSIFAVATICLALAAFVLLTLNVGNAKREVAIRSSRQSGEGAEARA